jgi:hypothetical protein
VQLATGPPDLGDLPAELAGIVACCMDRDPRKRPTSAALLAQLAIELTTHSDTHELGRDLLSGPALDLIAEYHREPRPVAAPEADDDTFGSQPAARAPGRPMGIPEAPQRRPARNRAAAMLAAGAAAIILLGGGAVLGAYLTGGGGSQASGSQNGAGSPTGQPADRGQTPAPSASANAGIPPFPGPPPRSLPPYPVTTTPVVIMSQPFGDTATVFVIRGSGWPPGAVITVTLVGYGGSPDHPVADSVGTFNYAINQAHEFVARGLPPGRYRVVVTAQGGIRRTVSFTVNDVRPPMPPAAPGASPSSH